MTDQVLYFFSKTRKQRSKLYIRMGLFCWVYVIGLLLYEEFGDKPVPDDLHPKHDCFSDLCSGVYSSKFIATSGA